MLREHGPLASGDAYFGEAWPVVEETMGRVKSNLETIISRLREDNYRFEQTYEEDSEDFPELNPMPGVIDPEKTISTYEGIIGPLPLAMKGWMKMVGDVTLLGNHPGWEKENMCTDALSIEFEEENWLEIGTENTEDWKHWVDKEGLEETGDMILEFSLCLHHKVNISGAGTYGMGINGAYIDPKVYVGDEMYFTDYLRHCFEWGGFPGFSCYEKGNDSGVISKLKKDLLPI